MAIGRPLSLTPNVATKNISADATANQTEFTVSGGYRINEIAVYRNGVRLAQGRDFTASDGSTVNLVNGATINDVIEFSIFDSFNIADAIVSVGSSQNVNGDLNVTGKLYGGTVDTDSLKIGVGTFASAIHVGTAFTVDASGNTNTVGMITAASFSGSGANLTGVASTDNILTGTAATFRNTAVSAGVPNVNIVGLATVGIITAYGAAELSSTVAVGGVVTLTDTTDATSTSTGALIISGGVGIAKSLHVGQNISVGGTLTYEDVTNVDSIGLVTARSGVNVSGGQLLVGSGVTIGNAGIVTSQGLRLADNKQIKFGTGDDSGMYYTGSHLYIDNNTAGDAYLRSTNINLQVNSASSSENALVATANEGVALYHNAIKTFETIGAGITIYGPEGGAGQICLSSDEGDDNADKWRITKEAGNDSFRIQNYKSGSWETNILATGDGAVELYHDGTKKFQTEGGNNAARIYGNTIIRSAADNVDIATFTDDGTNRLSNLYANGTKRLETTTSGVTVTGSVTATNYLGDGSALTGIGGDMDITSSLFV